MIAILIVCLLLVLLLLISARFLKGVVDPVKFDPAAVPSENALALHRELLIADMHADSLLYNNSLLVRSRQGHVDLPRLIEGNVAIQVFTCVSKFPVGANINRSGSNGDFITLAALLQGWPVKTWSSLCERALYQAAKS